MYGPYKYNARYYNGKPTYQLVSYVWQPFRRIVCMLSRSVSKSSLAAQSKHVRLVPLARILESILWLSCAQAPNARFIFQMAYLC